MNEFYPSFHKIYKKKEIPSSSLFYLNYYHRYQSLNLSRILGQTVRPTVLCIKLCIKHIYIKVSSGRNAMGERRRRLQYINNNGYFFCSTSSFHFRKCTRKTAGKSRCLLSLSSYKVYYLQFFYRFFLNAAQMLTVMKLMNREPELEQLK